MSISFPNNTRQIINQIRNVIGRPVLFNVAVISECTASGCGLNPVTNTSTNPFCETCNGDYYITSFSGVYITGHISQQTQDMMQWYTAGKTYDGDVRIQVEYTITNLDVIDATDHIIADGKKFEIKKYTPRGFQALNRILLDCVEAKE